MEGCLIKGNLIGAAVHQLKDMVCTCDTTANGQRYMAVCKPLRTIKNPVHALL